MSNCKCKRPFKIRISDEMWDQDGINFNMIRCCICGGKWGIINLDTNIIISYSFKKTIKPSRYISPDARYEVLKRQSWKCNFCGKHLKYSNKHKLGDEVAHIDHIHPFSEWETYNGNINEVSNLQALCPECNLKKHKNSIC